MQYTVGDEDREKGERRCGELSRSGIHRLVSVIWHGIAASNLSGCLRRGQEASFT